MHKLITLSELLLKDCSVVTNGCFDLLHVGHIRLLQYAASLGHGLTVGLNDDASVRLLKGHGRPIVPQVERAEMLCALECVKHVVIFSGETAEDFLASANADFWVKGGDYTLETLNPKERAIAEECGTRIVLFPTVPGHSTTNIVTNVHRNTFPSPSALA